MTPYERGFLTKCAEYGVDADTAMGLLKTGAKMPAETLGIVKKLMQFGKNNAILPPAPISIREGIARITSFPQLSRKGAPSRKLNGPEGLRLFRKALSAHGIEDSKWVRRTIRDGAMLDALPRTTVATHIPAANMDEKTSLIWGPLSPFAVKWY